MRYPDTNRRQDGRSIQFFMISLLVLIGTSCGDKTGISTHHQLQISIAAPPVNHQRATREHHAKLTPHNRARNSSHFEITLPTQRAEFDCFGINIIGSGIAPSGREHESDPSSRINAILAGSSFCGYAGVTSQHLAIAQNQTVKLSVPSGRNRIIQIIGILDPNHLVCNSGKALGDTQYSEQGASIYVLEQKILDILAPQAVRIPSTWPNLSNEEREARNLECHNRDEASPSPSPTGQTTLIQDEFDSSSPDTPVYSTSAPGQTAVTYSVTGGTNPGVPFLSYSSIASKAFINANMSTTPTNYSLMSVLPIHTATACKIQITLDSITATNGFIFGPAFRIATDNAFFTVSAEASTLGVGFALKECVASGLSNSTCTTASGHSSAPATRTFPITFGARYTQTSIRPFIVENGIETQLGSEPYANSNFGTANRVGLAGNRINISDSAVIDSFFVTECAGN